MNKNYLSIRWSGKEEQARNYFFHCISGDNLKAIEECLAYVKKYRYEKFSWDFKFVLAEEGLCYAAQKGKDEICKMLLQYAIFRAPRRKLNPLMYVKDEKTATTIFTNFLFVPSKTHLRRSGKVILTLLASLRKQNYFPKDVQKLIVYHTDEFADYLLCKIVDEDKTIPQQFITWVEKRVFNLTVHELSKMRQEAIEQNADSESAQQTVRILTPMCAQCQFADKIRETIHQRLTPQTLICNGQEDKDSSLQMRDMQDSIRTTWNKCVIQ